MLRRRVMARNIPVPKRTALSGILALSLAALVSQPCGAEEGKAMRYFVGAELAPVPQEALAVLAGELQLLAPEGLRWSPPPAYHLTLRFLDELDGPTLDAVAAALEVVALEAGVVTTRLRGLGSFPWRGKGGPRVLWAGLEEPHAGLDDLARRIDAAVRGVGLPAADYPFRPHITLARAARHSVKGELAAALARLEDQDLGGWSIQSFVLFQAHRPDPEGGYVAVRRFRLR